MEWLFRSSFDPLTNIALWSIAAVLVTTIVLFVYTIGLRYATNADSRNRRRFLAQWRDVFGGALLGDGIPEDRDLPVIRRRDSTDLLEEWNRVRSVVDGKAVDNLIRLAERTGIPELAKKLLRSRRMSARILAVQTIGHLRMTEFRDKIRELVDHDNTAVSVTAAAALVDIDPDYGIGAIVPMINRRRDWPRNRVSVILRHAGSARISEPMYRAIRSEDASGQSYLLQFARLIESEILDALVDELLCSSHDPRVITASLNLVSGFKGVPRIAALTQHEEWYVRMQAAKVLGRVGQEEHLSLLESLLDDSEWWVRYRAGQAISSLPFLGPNQLRALRNRQSDPYAVDILNQCFAEVGLA